MTPVDKFTEGASLIVPNSMSTKNDRKIVVGVTNTTESPYTINKNTQIAEFSIITPEQSKFIKPVDTAILSMIPEGDPDLVTYLTELLRTNKPDQQNNSFWFPTPENQHPAKQKIKPRFKHESSQNSVNCNEEKNQIRQTTLGHEWNS